MREGAIRIKQLLFFGEKTLNRSKFNAVYFEETQLNTFLIRSYII